MSRPGSSRRSEPRFGFQNSAQIEESSSQDTEDEYASSNGSESLGEISHATDHINGATTSLPKWPTSKKLADIDISEPLSFAYYKKNVSQNRHSGSGHNSYIVIHPGLKTDGPSYRYGSSINDETPHHKYLTSPSDQHENIFTKKSVTNASSELVSSKPSLSNGRFPDTRKGSREDREETKEVLKETEEDQSLNLEEDERQAKLLARLKNIVGSEGNPEKLGWGIFIKDAARARISTAFLNAKDHAIFDATTKEIDVIGDKTYIQKINKARRMSFRRKREDAPKLRKILERHGIISKKNLEKKNLKKVLHGLTRRKSKITYVRGWMKSIKREVKYKLGFLTFLRENIILHPKGKIRLVWDTISLFLIFYDLFYVPLTLGFELNAEGFLFFFDIFKDLFFIFDVFLNCITSYYDKNGNLIQKPKAIVTNYMRTKWFIPDILTALPIPLIVDFVIDEEGSSNLSFIRLIRFIRFVRLIRIIKALKLLRIYSKIEEFFYSSLFNGIKSIFSLLFYIILCAHWIACLWHFVGRIDYDSTGSTWMATYDLLGKPLSERYVASLYFAIMTMITVGYGDIVPVTMAERIISIIAMLSGCGMFAYSMNSIGILVQNLNARSSKTRQLYYSVNKYMEDKNVSKPLRNKVIQYLDYMAETQKQDKMAEETIFSSLSESLQTDLKKDINGQVLRESLLFQSTFGSTFRNALSYSLVQQTLSPGEIIFDENDKSQSLYFLAAGNVEIFISKSGNVLSVLEKDTHFGEYAFFTGRSRTAAARSQNFTNVFHIKKEVFMKIIEEYPYEKEMFHMIKDKVNLLNEYDKLKMKCYICHQEGHYAKYCFRVHYVPDRDMILNAHFKENLKFQTEYKRFKRTRFHALTGRKLMMTRLRDLIIDHPDEMRKHVQSDLFKSNSFVPPHLQNKNFLEMPRVVGARRRSRTLTGSGIPEHLLEAITPTSQDNSAERMAFVSQQKNKIITKLKTLKTARPDGQQSSDEESGNTEEKEQKEFKEYKASEKSIPSMGKIILPSPDSAKNFTFEAASSNADEVNIYKPTLQRTSTIRHLLDHTYEDFVMDMVTNYQVYFPHNNSKKIIDSINLPHRRRRPTNMGSGVIPKKKLGEMFNRSNSAHAKKLHKMNSSASPEKRGKSLFVGNSRFSIWNAAKNTLKRKPTGANNQPNISPIGLAASKHSALAGLIPHALAMTSGKNKTTGKPNPRRRQSRSLGNLDSPYLPKLNAAEISQEMSGDLRLAEKNSEAASESRDFSPKKLKPSPLGQFMRRGMSLAPAFIRRGRQDTWGNNSSFNSEV